MKGRRVLLIALSLIIAIVLFRAYFLVPRSDAVREDIQRQYRLLQKYETYLEGEQMTEEEMNSVIEAMQNIEQRLVSAKSEFLAAALLQEEISELSSRSGLKITTMRPLNTSKTEKYLNLPIYFEGYGSIRQVSDFLRNLESSKYLIKIDKLNVNITNVQNPKDLKVKIQISGLGQI